MAGRSFATPERINERRSWASARMRATLGSRPLCALVRHGGAAARRREGSAAVTARTGSGGLHPYPHPGNTRIAQPSARSLVTPFAHRFRKAGVVSSNLTRGSISYGRRSRVNARTGRTGRDPRDRGSPRANRPRATGTDGDRPRDPHPFTHPAVAMGGRDAAETKMRIGPHGPPANAGLRTSAAPENARVRGTRAPRGGRASRRWGRILKRPWMARGPEAS